MHLALGRAAAQGHSTMGRHAFRHVTVDVSGLWVKMWGDTCMWSVVFVVGVRKSRRVVKTVWSRFRLCVSF